MSSTEVIREGFMNGSRTILPRVGVGERGGVRGGVLTHPSAYLTVGATTRREWVGRSATRMAGGR
jgi:hypothetical protein